MQDKDSEALRNQRRRRKRIARMKHTIIAIIAGWIILSMILIIFSACPDEIHGEKVR